MATVPAMKRTTALTAVALALCAMVIGGCRGDANRGATSPGRGTVSGPGTTTQTGGAKASPPPAADPATVSNDVSSDLDDIDQLLKDLDIEQSKASLPLPDQD